MCRRKEVTVTKPICVVATTAAGCREMRCSSRGLKSRTGSSANLLVLILKISLNIINCITILSGNYLILMGGGAELAMVDSGRRNPSTTRRGNFRKRPVAGEQPAVEGGTRLLL